MFKWAVKNRVQLHLLAMLKWIVIPHACISLCSLQFLRLGFLVLSTCNAAIVLLLNSWYESIPSYFIQANEGSASAQKLHVKWFSDACCKIRSHDGWAIHRTMEAYFLHRITKAICIFLSHKSDLGGEQWTNSELWGGESLNSEI